MKTKQNETTDWVQYNTYFSAGVLLDAYDHPQNEAEEDYIILASASLGELGELTGTKLHVTTASVGGILKITFGQILVWISNRGGANYWNEFCHLVCEHAIGDKPNPDQLQAILDFHARVNLEVWPREETFEPESAENLKWRKVGRAMHLFYEAVKYINYLAGGTWKCNEERGKQFASVLNDGLCRAKAGDQIALAVMKDKWGMTF